MPIVDRHISTIRKRLWLTPYDIQGLGLNAEADATLQAFETAGITYFELASLGMAAAHMADGEFLNGYFRCPIDLDPKFAVGWRVCYTLDHNSGTASVDWILLQDAIA